MVKKMVSLYISLYLVVFGFVPVRSALAQGDKVYTIGIINLDAKGVSEVEAEVLSDKLRSHITQLVSSDEYRQMKEKDSYEVVERQNMDRIFEQFDVQNTGCVSDSCAIEFGKMLQADRILLGTIGIIGNTFSVSTRIIDIESSKTVATADRQHRGSIDEVMSTVIVEVGNELMLGRKKKSKKIWYLLAGLAVAAAGAGAALSGGDGKSGGGGGLLPPENLPLPPERP